MPFVGFLKRIDVASFFRSANYRREFACLDEWQCHEEAGQPSVSVLKGMNPDEFMVKPRCFKLRCQIQLRVAAVEFKKAFDFGFNLLGWTIFVDKSVFSSWVVGPNLPSAAAQRDFDTLSERIDSCRCLLMPSQKLMPFAN